MLVSSFQMIMHRMLVTGPWLTLLRVPVQQPRWSKSNGVWCGLLGVMTVDPYFFTKNVDQQRYGKTIRIPPLFQEWNIFFRLSGDFCLTEQLIGALCNRSQRIIWVPLCTYLLTPWSRILEKLTGSQLVMKFPTVYETQRFITAFTSACHVLSWGRSMQSMPPHPIHLKSNSANWHICVCVHACMQPLCTYLLTPWSRILLEKLTSSQLVKKFPTVYETQRFITAITSACHVLLLRQINPVHATPSIHLKSNSSSWHIHVCVCVCARVCARACNPCVLIYLLHGAESFLKS